MYGFRRQPIDVRSRSSILLSQLKEYRTRLPFWALGGWYGVWFVAGIALELARELGKSTLSH
jgi:hypothetical protein